MQRNVCLPKSYLSYSALSLWWRDKNQFRSRYYLNEPSPDNVYSLFGREVHALLETDHHLKHIPRLKKREHKIEVKVSDVPLLGYLDGFGKSRRSFLDFKTGMRKENGAPRWTELEVLKLDQLPFYSMLIQEKYGTVYPVCRLIWLETRWKPTTEQVGSLILETDGNELELTGFFKVFKREIAPRERKAIKEKTLQGAYEISKDYTQWIKNK